MTAAAADRLTITREGKRLSLAVKGATKIFAGTMVAKPTAGYVVPATGATATNLTMGIAERQADNSTGADGDVTVEVVRDIVGIFANSASGDLITIADIGKTCYVVDDSTVAKTDNSAARPAAGKVMNVTTEGVHVYFA